MHGTGTEAARMKLTQMNIPFTDEAFLESARQGHADSVKILTEYGAAAHAKDSMLNGIVKEIK